MALAVLSLYPFVIDVTGPDFEDEETVGSEQDLERMGRFRFQAIEDQESTVVNLPSVH